jgi:hypothetical protein
MFLSNRKMKKRVKGNGVEDVILVSTGESRRSFTRFILLSLSFS